jgi:hypothetical protein
MTPLKAENERRGELVEGQHRRTGRVDRKFEAKTPGQAPVMLQRF